MRVRLVTRARLVASVAALSLAACEVEPTQLLVVINTDLAVPAEIGEVRIRVWGPDQEDPREDRTLPLATAETLPASFGIAPRDGDARRQVRAAVEGRLGDRFVVATEAATSFVENEVMRLDLFLARSCVGVECDPGQTCRDGQCEDVEIAPGGLPGYSPGESLGDTPPDRPPDRTVLIPLEAATDLRHLDLDVAPDGSVVIAGSFQGTLAFDEVASSDLWAGFVAGYTPDGALRFRQIVRGPAAEEAFVYAVTVVDAEQAWVATGCNTSLIATAMGSPATPLYTCPMPSRVDFRVLLPDGDLTLADVNPMVVPAELEAHLVATPRWVASTYRSEAAPVPWAVTLRDLQEEGLPLCILPASLVPTSIGVQEDGTVWVAGTYDAAVDAFGLPAATGIDAFVSTFAALPDPPGPCTASSSFVRRGAGDDGVVALELAPEGEAALTRSIDGDARVEKVGTQTVVTLAGPGEERLDDVALAPDGRWVVAGVASPGATLDGVALGSFEGTRIVVLVLDAERLDWRVLGETEEGWPVAVEVDPTTSEVIVVGVTSAPTDFDPGSESERAVFLHRFALPAE